MKKLLLAGVGLTALVGTAVAADMPLAVKAPVYTPAYSWTGCYGGGYFGSLFATNGWSLASAPVGTPEGSFNITDLVGGLQGGCNYQVGAWVLGAQGDYGWTQAQGTNVGNFTALTDRTKITSLSSATGRLGYAFDRLLPYVKGGGAWSGDRYDAFVPGSGTIASTLNVTRSGWTVGGGIEYAIVSNLSMFIEYDWYNFGTTSNTLSGAFPVMSIHERESVVKMGANWKVWPW